MTKSYLAPLVSKPVIITEAGQYITRGGETVTIKSVSPFQDFCCIGVYNADGHPDTWNKSGRIFANVECDNDIVRKVN